MSKYWGPGSGLWLSTTMIWACWKQCLSLSGRINYEESMMVRLSVSKREKGRRKRASMMSSQLHSLTHFSDISALTGGTAHLDEVRLRYSGRRYMSVLPAKCMWGFIPWETWEGMLAFGKALPFLYFSISRIRILLRSGRRYLRKAGRKKVSKPLT